MTLQKDLNLIADVSSKRLLESQGEVCVDPFKHISIDNFFPEQFANNILEHFPPLSDGSWEHSNDTGIEIKYRSTWNSEFDIPDGIVDAVRVLNSSLFLRAMSKIMGIPKIVPDPYFSGGGLNVTTKNGLLDVHVDGNYHDSTGLNRRLNVLLYLNPNWKSEYGGQLGLYDQEGKECVKKIEPAFNRLVIFETHDKSYHGLPEPLNVPEGVDRKSLILYYYTVESRPADQVLVSEPHSALWRNKDFHDKRGNKTRTFT